jgi:hypothetical protein
MTPGASDRGLPLFTRPDGDDVAFYAEHGWWISPKVLSDDYIDAVQRFYRARDRTLPFEDEYSNWTEDDGLDVVRNQRVRIAAKRRSAGGGLPAGARCDDRRRLARRPRRLGHLQLRAAATAWIRSTTSTKRAERSGCSTGGDRRRGLLGKDILLCTKNPAPARKSPKVVANLRDGLVEWVG